MATFTGQPGINNTFNGTAAADTFLFATANLNALDTVTGGGGADLLQLTTAGVLAANALAGVSGVGTIQLAAGANSITLANGNFVNVAGAKITVFGNTGNDTIDASGLTGVNAVDFRSGAGLDVLKGGAGADIFRFAAADLAGDTIQGGAGSDLLQFSTAGVLGATALAGMTGVETIGLAAGTNSITLVNGNLTGVAGTKITVFGSSGADTIDGSGLVGANAVTFNSGGGLDVLRGGAGPDVFRFAATDLASDTIQGGTGSDLLQMTTAGVLGATALSAMTGVETIGLAAGTNSVTLVDGNYTGVAGAKITVFGGSGADTINAAGLTGAKVVDFRSGGGLDVLRGGAGNDIVRFAATDLAGDTIQGGGGSDLLILSTAGVLGAAALANLSAVETIALATGTNSVTLVDGNLTGVAGAKISVYGGGGADTIDGSGLTGSNAVAFSSGGGLDVLRGGAGADTFRFAAADLNGDTISGGAGSDLLQLATAGALGATALANMSGVESIGMIAGGNSVTLVNGNFTGVAGAKITVFGNTGSDTIDASGLTGVNAVDFRSGAGLDVLRGGAGADIFRFAAADLAGDTVQGGAGSDQLVFTAAGVLAANALAQMTGVETILLAPGTNGVTLVNGNFTGVAGARITVFGGSGADTIDGSGLTGSNALVFNSGAGNDVLKGGAGNDAFRFAAGDLNALDSISGGSGFDKLELTNAGTVTAAALAGMTGVETIALANGTNSITLANGNFTGVGGVITVLGNSGNDTIDGSGLTNNGAIDITSGPGLDTLKGGGGFDTFRFAAGDLNGDTVQGGGGYDSLVLTSAGSLAAGALANVTGVDAIVAAAGGNTITLTDSLYAAPLYYPDFFSVFGSAGSSTINAASLSTGHGFGFYDGGGTDTITGSASNDQYIFTGGNLFAAGDVLDGGGGNDYLYFDRSMAFIGNGITNVEELRFVGTADAAVTISGANAERLSLVGGNDFDGVSTVYTIQLAANSTTNLSNLSLVIADAGDAINVISNGGTTRVSLSSSISSFTGSTDSDEVFDYSTGGAQAISTGGGADTIYYVDGFVHEAGDTVDGGAGDDTVLVDRSMDFLGNSLVNVERLALLNGAGELTLRISGESAAGLKHVGSASGLTEIYSIELSAGSATDLSNITLDSPDAGDAINVVATSGNTAVTLNNQIASFTGSADSDTVGYAVGGGYKTGAVIDGGGGDDRIVLDPFSASIINGGSGDDTLVLLGGATINLAVINDQALIISASIKNFEHIDASASTAAVIVAGRDDVFSVLIGSSAGDQFDAGDAGARITGGLGGDTLNGGMGTDYFFYSSTDEAAGDSINGGGGINLIAVTGDTDLTGATISFIQYLSLAAADASGNLLQANVSATISGTQAQALATIEGSILTGTTEMLFVKASTATLNLSGLSFEFWSGNDIVDITGTTGNDTITGSIANDVIHGGGGNDRLSGGDGNDVIGYDFYHSEALDGGTGNDTVRLDSLDFSGQPTSVTVNLKLGKITEFFSSGGDFTFDATSFENADFSQNLFSTTMIGTDFDNTLIGGSDADTLIGGLSADTLTGGGGADSFVWNSKIEGGDTITDFTPGADKLVFSTSAFGFNALNFNSVSIDPSAINTTDLLITSQTLNNAVDVKNYVNGLVSRFSHEMFVIASNSAGHEILYFTSNTPRDGTEFGDTAFYQIADLGDITVAVATLNDFVFI